MEQRTGLKIACLEEVALNKGFVTPAQFERLIEPHATSAYGRYLRRVLHEQQEQQGQPVRRAA